MMNNNYINNLSLILQALSLEILFKDFNNGDLMQELQHQNRDYLEKIIEQNEEILNILKERRKNYDRKVNRDDRTIYKENTR